MLKDMIEESDKLIKPKAWKKERDSLIEKHMTNMQQVLEKSLILKYDDAPFKALFNAQYSKDISKKVHSVYVNQAEKGIHGTVFTKGCDTIALKNCYIRITVGDFAYEI